MSLPECMPLFWIDGIPWSQFIEAPSNCRSAHCSSSHRKVECYYSDQLLFTTTGNTIGGLQLKVYNQFNCFYSLFSIILRVDLYVCERNYTWALCFCLILIDHSETDVLVLHTSRSSIWVNNQAMLKRRQINNNQPFRKLCAQNTIWCNENTI